MERSGVASGVEESVTQEQEGFNRKVSTGHLIYGLYTVGVAVTLALKLGERKTYEVLCVAKRPNVGVSRAATRAD
jgi:hypothetical protein